MDRASEGGGRRRLTGSARSKPRWRRRGAYVAATQAGGRRKKGRPRWMADGGHVHRSKRDGFGLRGAHRSDEGIEKERANGSDSLEGVRQRWNSTVAAGGERKGKSPRGDEDSIKGGGSISGAQGFRFWDQIGWGGAVEVRRREAASGRGRRRRQGHAERRRSSGRRLRAFEGLTELSCKLERARENEEGERREALLSRAQ
uniref:OSJNBb0089K06.7 protein n=1 Tax=Oryza sativa subsp. japonica TaxID=39947 RepID=Q7XX77_ORYSJ|nr:OSJNBb0089K06.7 [Oryza sativa Japonica Group]